MCLVLVVEDGGLWRTEAPRLCPDQEGPIWTTQDLKSGNGMIPLIFITKGLHIQVIRRKPKFQGYELKPSKYVSTKNFIP